MFYFPQRCESPSFRRYHTHLESYYSRPSQNGTVKPFNKLLIQYDLIRFRTDWILMSTNIHFSWYSLIFSPVVVAHFSSVMFQFNSVLLWFSSALMWPSSPLIWSGSALKWFGSALIQLDPLLIISEILGILWYFNIFLFQ